jgi:hypothetical protein
MYRPAECNGYGDSATMLLYLANGGLHGVPGTADIVKQDNLLP